MSNRMKLGDVATVVMGQAPPGGACNKDGIGEPFVKAGEFKEPYPVIREWTTAPTKRAQSGDVLVCVVGATAGKINLGIDCVIGRSVAAVRPLLTRLDTHYLYHFLVTKTLVLRASSQGMAQGVITREMLLETEIPLPPLEEQRRIAAILDKASHLNQLSTHLDSLRRQAGESLYLSLFGDPIVNPHELPSQKIGEIADCQLGKMLDKKRQHGNSSRPYLRNANVRWFDVNTEDCLCMDIEESEMDRFGVMHGDLLVCEGGEPGRSAIWKGESGAYGFQKALHRIRPKKDILTPQFLNWSLWILAQRGLLLDHITSATIAHLTREKLVQIEVPLPPMSTQKLFAQRLDKIENLLAHSAFRQKLLSSLRLSLVSEFLV